MLTDGPYQDDELRRSERNVLGSYKIANYISYTCRLSAKRVKLLDLKTLRDDTWVAQWYLMLSLQCQYASM